jgi:hypothetical protein
MDSVSVDFNRAEAALWEHGDTWDALRNEPRFQTILAQIQQAIPIANRSSSRAGFARGDY